MGFWCSWWYAFDCCDMVLRLEWFLNNVAVHGSSWTRWSHSWAATLLCRFILGAHSPVPQFVPTSWSNNWGWCHQTWGSFQRLCLSFFSVDFHAFLLIFCLLFFVPFLLSFFSFLPSVSPFGYVPGLTFSVFPIAFARLTGLKSQCYVQMDC